VTFHRHHCCLLVVISQTSPAAAVPPSAAAFNTLNLPHACQLELRLPPTSLAGRCGMARAAMLLAAHGHRIPNGGQDYRGLYGYLLQCIAVVLLFFIATTLPAAFLWRQRMTMT